jgi:hypothetical protein
LAEELDANRDSIKKAINRDSKKVFTKVASADGKVVKFGVLDRRAS